MSLQDGPRKIEKLAPGCKVMDMEKSNSQSMLLFASADNKLQSFYLKPSIHGGIQSKLLPMTSLDICCIPSLFSFSGSKSIVHTDDDLLVINNKRQLRQKGKINHLLVDDSQVSMVTCLDTITINSNEKGVQLGELHYYGGQITALCWNNSLTISGDEGGRINLWDINKEKVIHSNTFYNSQIDSISSYVDFIHTNFYYSLSKTQRKIAFHDLRTFKPIKIISDIGRDTLKVVHNKSGKLFLLGNKKIEVIDVYQSFSILGVFSELKGQKLQEFLLQKPEGKSYERNLTDLTIWNQYAVAGCDNGCIQIYNSDTFQCMYAYGLCEYSGIKKMKKVDNSLIVLEEKGVVSMAQWI